MSTLLPIITYYCLLYAHSMPSASRVPWSAKTAARRETPMLSHDIAVPLYPPAQSPAQSPVRHCLSSLPSTTHKQKKVPISVMYITSITHIKDWTSLHVASLVTQKSHSLTSLHKPPNPLVHCPRRWLQRAHLPAPWSTLCLHAPRTSERPVCVSIPVLAAAGLTPHDRIRCVAR